MSNVTVLYFSEVIFDITIGYYHWLWWGYTGLLKASAVLVFPVLWMITPQIDRKSSCSLYKRRDHRNVKEQITEGLSQWFDINSYLCNLLTQRVKRATELGLQCGQNISINLTYGTASCIWTTDVRFYQLNRCDLKHFQTLPLWMTAGISPTGPLSDVQSLVA